MALYFPRTWRGIYDYPWHARRNGQRTNVIGWKLTRYYLIEPRANTHARTKRTHRTIQAHTHTHTHKHKLPKATLWEYLFVVAIVKVIPQRLTRLFYP